MKISILGCGWLGLPLAEDLRDAGHCIKGSTTSPEKLELLKGKKITPFLIRLNPEIECENCEDFWDADVLVLNIPSRGHEDIESYHPQQVASVIEKLNDSPIEFVIFVSSTSVYPKKPGVVGEEDAQMGKASRASGNALLKAEKLLMDQSYFSTTVIRFGGLYGFDRQPVKYLSGRKNMDRGNAPVNLIHRDDCITIIRKIIQQDKRDEIFNGVSDGHPPRKMYYPAAARAMGIEPPVFNHDDEENYKVVSNRKLKEMLNYTFRYPNPMDVKIPKS